MSAIVARGIAKSFGSGAARSEVLKAIDLTIEPGGLTLIMGPSGCGKSTLLAVLSGLLRPDAGSADVLGTKLWDLGKAAIDAFRLARCGFVFQGFNLFGALTALEQVMLPLNYAGIDGDAAIDRARRALGDVGLDAQADLRPTELSGGQKQRVAIARALALSPKIMLFDEVTSALDPELVEEVLNVMRKLASETDMTMLLVTHEMGFAHDFADRILFFDRGKIVEEGKPDEIFRNPRQERTQTFLRKIIAAGHRV